eukprot:PhM_4_TR11637/c0_g1_i2/m.40350
MSRSNWAATFWLRECFGRTFRLTRMVPPRCAAISPPKKIALLEHIEEIQLEKTILEQEHDGLRAIQTNLVARPSSDAVDSTQYVASVGDMASALRTTAQRMQEIRRATLSKTREIARITAEIKAIAATIDATKRIVHVAAVYVTRLPLPGKDDTDPVTFDLSYIISQVLWVPFYTIRQSTMSADGQQPMTVLYQATLQQSSGTNWGNVSVELTTAEATSNRRVPVLQRWQLFLSNEPVHQVFETSARRHRVMMKAKTASYSGSPPTMAVEVEEDYLESPASLSTAVTSSGVTEVFTLAGRHTVPSGQPVRVLIAELTFITNLTYTAVPKSSSKVYVQAALKNTSPYTLLPGPSIVFMDGGWAGTSSIPLVSVNGTTSVGLGIDGAMTVLRQLVSRTKERHGGLLTRGSVSESFKYDLVVRNQRAFPVLVHVRDQIPMSDTSDMDIVVHSPRGIGDRETVKSLFNGKENDHTKNKENVVVVAVPNSVNTTLSVDGVIEWTRTIRGDGQVSIPLQFTVTYPEGYHVGGMEN